MRKFKFKTGHTLEVTTKGFTLWDDKCGRWVLDGSTFTRDKMFSVSRELPVISSSYTLEYGASYPVEKPVKKKKGA